MCKQTATELQNEAHNNEWIQNPELTKAQEKLEQKIQTQTEMIHFVERSIYAR